MRVFQTKVFKTNVFQKKFYKWESSKTRVSKREFFYIREVFQTEVTAASAFTPLSFAALFNNSSVGGVSQQK